MKKLLAMTMVLVLVLSLTSVATLTASADTLTEGDYEYELIDDGGAVRIIDYTGDGGDVTIPSTIAGKPVREIGERALDMAFSDKSLTSIMIPNSVTTIGELALGGSSALTSIVVERGNPVYHSAGNCLIESASKTLIVGCNSSVIPDDGSVTDISDYAFYNCVDLNSITIPNSVTTIGGRAFVRCNSLNSITIPDSVISIGDYVFSACASLETIMVESKNPVYYSEGNCLIEMATQTVIAGCKSSVIPNDGSVVHIGTGAFADCFKQSIIIPEGVTSIGEYAFYSFYNKDFISVTIPASVVTIGDYAFWFCDALSTVNYGGTQADRNNITIGSDNDALLNATWVYEFQPPEEPSGEPSAPSDVSADREPGDANGDGGLDMKDVLLVRKAIAGLRGTINETAADVNRDGSVDMKDVLLMRKFIAGLIETFA